MLNFGGVAIVRILSLNQVFHGMSKGFFHCRTLQLNHFFIGGSAMTRDPHGVHADSPYLQISFNGWKLHLSWFLAIEYPPLVNLYISILFPVGFPKEISSHWHVGFWFEKWHATRSWMDCQCQHHHEWLNTFPVIWTCLTIGTLQILCQKIGFSTKLEKNILDDRMSIFQSEKHHDETYRSNLPTFTQVIDSFPFQSKNIDTPVVPSANPLPQTSVLFACRCYQQSRLRCFTKSACQVVGFGGKKRWAGCKTPPLASKQNHQNPSPEHMKNPSKFNTSALKACKGHDGSRERLAILSFWQSS